MRQAPLGIIPFRLRIGVTGHRNIKWSEVLVEVPARVREVLPLESVTPVRLGVVSALAEGTDRFVVEEVFTYATLRNEDARLEVILPFDRSSYAQAQEFSAKGQAEFAELLDRATSVTELDSSFGGSLDSAYEAASQHVVARSDVLVALWDGQPSRGRGGTAETLLHAAEMGKPCIWLSTDGGPALATNFGEGRNRHFRHDVRRRVDLPRDDWSELSGAGADTLEPIQRAYQEFEAFNSAPMPPEPQLRQRVDASWVGGCGVDVGRLALRPCRDPRGSGADAVRARRVADDGMCDRSGSLTRGERVARASVTCVVVGGGVLPRRARRHLRGNASRSTACTLAVVPSPRRAIPV